MSAQAKSLKALISQYGVSFDASTIMNALIKAGYAENFEYLSSTGSGERKSFKKLSAEGERFGVNKEGFGLSIKTEARFFESKFPELLAVVVQQLNKEVNEIAGAS
ncbi:hypothetical protein [Pseudomonas agarici]|uniref:hypothetical protein n=1 Tax=Pseudomonas agarici TaxID=46677 RepID=UPI0015A09C56|nr:hypothetical protein [Pseudomonas agarici]NWB90232.1 hypothetical protein [Pseudomonas agarici]